VIATRNECLCASAAFSIVTHKVEGVSGNAPDSSALQAGVCAYLLNAYLKIGGGRWIRAILFRVKAENIAIYVLPP
jgi:hypothetical protein